MKRKQNAIRAKRDLLKHLGVKPGDRIYFEMMPSGEIRMRAAKPTGTLELLRNLGWKNQESHYH